MRTILPVIFLSPDDTLTTVATLLDMERALLMYADGTTKAYRKAVKAIAALSAGKGDRVEARYQFIAAMREAGVNVRADW